jgi:hypothetical protein
MSYRSDPAADAQLRRQARRLHWGLMVYLVVLLMIGIGVLRLAFTARRFDRLTVTRVEDTAIDAVGGPDDTADAVVVPVSGAVP